MTLQRAAISEIEENVLQLDPVTQGLSEAGSRSEADVADAARSCMSRSRRRDSVDPFKVAMPRAAAGAPGNG